MHTKRCQRGSLVGISSRNLGHRSRRPRESQDVTRGQRSQDIAPKVCVANANERDGRSEIQFKGGQSAEASANKVDTSFCLDDLD